MLLWTTELFEISQPKGENWAVLDSQLISTIGSYFVVKEWSWSFPCLLREVHVP